MAIENKEYTPYTSQKIEEMKSNGKERHSKRMYEEAVWSEKQRESD